jgi:hypothetical protein
MGYDISFNIYFQGSRVKYGKMSDEAGRAMVLQVMYKLNIIDYDMFSSTYWEMSGW